MNLTPIVYSILKFIRIRNKDNLERVEIAEGNFDERKRAIRINEIALGLTMTSIASIVIYILVRTKIKVVDNYKYGLTNMVIFVLGAYLYKHLIKEYYLPESKGEILPIENDFKSILNRIIFYIKDSIFISMIFSYHYIKTRISLLTGITDNKLLAYILEFLLSITIFSLFGLIRGEYNIYKYKKQEEELK